MHSSFTISAWGTALSVAMTPLTKGGHYNAYLAMGQLKVQLMMSGMASLDTRSPEEMLRASQFIETMQSFFKASMSPALRRSPGGVASSIGNSLPISTSR